MWWDKWIPHKFRVKQEIFAIEICIKESETRYHFTHLKQKNRQLELVSTESVTKLTLPAAVIKNKIPLVIIVNGKGIVLKKINLAENPNEPVQTIVAQHLPTLDTNDFYIQLYKQEDKTAFITLCRKELVNEFLNVLKSLKTDVALVFLGPAEIIGLQPFWSHLSQLQTSVQQMTLSNNCIETISTATFNNEKDAVFNLDALNIRSSFTLGFSGGFNYLLQNTVKENFNAELTQLETKHLEKNKLRFLQVTAVAFAFAIAVVNVLFYTSYFDTNSKLETELAVYQGKYEEVNKLLDDYQRNKSLIETAGVLSKNRLSEYADRIGSSMPDGITLTDLYFNPKKAGDDENDSLVAFDNRLMIIKGNCDKSLIINEWVNVLKTQKFVSDVSLEKYVYTNNGSQPNFEIKLLTAQ